MDDSILIERPPEAVFQTLIDPDSITKISQNIGDVELETAGMFEKDYTYRRVLYSHGIPNPQEVVVAEFESNRRLVTKTTLVGFNVTYEYILEPAPNGGAWLTIHKIGEGGWLIFRPLAIHLMTRPEHDGDHLQRIKAVSEGN